MRTGSYSSEKKESTVKLRVTDDMRKFLDVEARRQGVTISMYIRKIIASEMKK